MTTLRTLLAAHPDAFYPQTWYAEERFLDASADPKATGAPFAAKFPVGKQPYGTKHLKALPTAATLAALYVANPTAPCWRFYQWCRDTDVRGHQVYVGAVNGKGLEIHRHLHLTALWRYPTWK